MHKLVIPLLILIIAALVRLAGLGAPGLQHDEIFKAQEGRVLWEQGDFRVFYESNQGHEGGYVWLLALSYALFGTSVMMVRFPPLALGMLTVALTYRVTGEIVHRRAAYIAAGMAAVSWWLVFPNRVGLRANLLPLVALLVLWGLHRLWQRRGARTRTAILTGLALGFALYTYTSAFALYAAFAVFALAAVRQRPDLLRPLLVTGVLAAALAVPMVVARLTDPLGFDRASSIARPLNDARAGNPAELQDNAARLALLPIGSGDPEWRYNIALRPLFLLPVGLLVYAGMLVALRRSPRQPVYAALVTLALVGLVPSLLTVSAPSYLRTIAASIPAFVFVALALDALPNKRAVWALGTLAIALTGARDFAQYHGEWLHADAVNSIYRADLRLAAQLPPAPHGVFIATPDTELDPLIFPFYRPGTQAAFFDGRTTMVQREGALLLVSPFAPISPAHQPLLDAAERLAPLRRADGSLSFDVYRLGPVDLRAALHPVYADPGTLPYPREPLAGWANALAYPVNFGDVVALVGVDLPRTTIAAQRDGVNIQLYLRPLVTRADQPLNVFVHMLRRDGTLHAQRDLMGMPPRQWDPDTIIVQDNFVIAGDTPPGRYVIALGVYNYVTGARLPIAGSAADQALVGVIRVR